MPGVARWKQQLRNDPELRAKFELSLALRQAHDVRLAFHDWAALKVLVVQARLERGSRRIRRADPQVPELPASTPTPEDAQDLPLDVRLRLVQRLMALPAIQDFVTDAQLRSDTPTDVLGVEVTRGSRWQSSR